MYPAIGFVFGVVVDPTIKVSDDGVRDGILFRILPTRRIIIHGPNDRTAPSNCVERDVYRVRLNVGCGKTDFGFRRPCRLCIFPQNYFGPGRLGNMAQMHGWARFPHDTQVKKQKSKVSEPEQDRTASEYGMCVCVYPGDGSSVFRLESPELRKNWKSQINTGRF